MALVFPSLQSFRPYTFGQWGEYRVLQQLQDGLPDTFKVFHGVNWSAVHEGVQRFGEFDAVVLAPNGHMVLLEIKSGEVTVVEGRLSKAYGAHHKDIGKQTGQQHAAMRSRLAQAGLPGVRVSQFLVLPDARIDLAPIAYPRERIVDATQQDELCRLILAASAVPLNEPIEADRLERFLEGTFALAPDVTARIGQLTLAVQALSDGLATWVPRMRSASGMVQVHATAGAGKTQLALRLLCDAAQAGQRARYVCFNRPLADHITRIAPARCEVATFHESARTHWERTHGAVDFAESGIFERMAAAFELWCAQAPAQLDLLIIDESQDFAPAWVEALGQTLKPEGRLYLLGDPMQAVYGREPFELPDATTVCVDENFRSPKRIVEALNALGLAPRPVTAKCPLEGELPGFTAYDPAQDPGGVQAAGQVVAALLREGYAPEQIVLVTHAGHERSQILREPAIAGLALRKYAGRFDAAGNAVWTPGTLMAESLLRFKGQAAPVVVLCEIDFEHLDDAQRRKLFIGFTRAQYRLECVLSMAAQAALVQGL
jgi:hypothetical protein